MHPATTCRSDSGCKQNEQSELDEILHLHGEVFSGGKSVIHITNDKVEDVLW